MAVMIEERKVAIVTGASRGLGLAIANRLAEDGFIVVTCARTGNVTQYLDVANKEEVELLIRDTAYTYAGIDALVCNAGVYRDADWRAMISTNFIGTLLCVDAVVPLMKGRGYGRIVTISGGGVGGAPVPELAVYAATKAAVVQYTETVAVDLEGTGVTINAVAPGPQYTENQKLQAVDLIAFLVSPETENINGRLISAARDDWRSLTTANLLPDDYRLRRVVP